jgi:GMP synthase-like glutamine amidotransferase
VSNIACIQHVPFESPGRVAEWAAARGHEWTRVRVFDGDAMPAAGDVDALVVMGGPMGVHDGEKFAWLPDEKRTIQRAILDRVPVLGICLGAQLIAHVLGARVYRNRFREVGWFPVEATDAGVSHDRFALPRRFTAFHWHGDAFDLPPGAVRLAGNAACECQAFAVGRTLGLQFHLEITAETIDALAHHCKDDLNAGPYVQTVDEMRTRVGELAGTHRLLDSLLDGWMKEDA